MPVKPIELKANTFSIITIKAFASRKECVRIAHLETGLVAESSSEDTRWDNYVNALKQLFDKLEAL